MTSQGRIRKFASGPLALLLLLLPVNAADIGGLELFLLIGQSNMAGRGVVEDRDRSPVAGVWTLTKELDWKPAADPLHFDKPEIAGVGLGRSFATELLKARSGARIGLIPAAFGGTSLEQWSPGGELFLDAVRRAHAAMKSGRLRGILWHQGEAECGSEEKARSYRERFVPIIVKLRAALGNSDLPVVVGQLGEFLYTRKENASPYARVVNEQLALLPLSLKRSVFVSSSELTHKGDELHFDAASLREFGRRYAHAFMLLDSGWAVAP